jgi:hypothetical protein
MAHSDETREFRITGEGIRLVDRERRVS